jgi:hypothetical protein
LMAQGNAVSGTLFTARVPIFSSNSKGGIFYFIRRKTVRSPEWYLASKLFPERYPKRV